MPINLDELRILKEFKGNESNRVFLVENKISSAKMVLKIIKVEEFEKEILEIEIHKTLDPKFVIKLIDYEITNSYILMTIEYASFGDLFSNLKHFKNLPEEKLLKFFYKFVRIICYLHFKGFVHRDIKPENILVCKKMRPKLSDFGTTGNKSIIKNTFCGTFEYMAPELFIGNQQTEKVDIWALGVLLYEMTHNRTPFKKENIEVMKVLFEKKEINYKSDLNPKIKNLIEKILQFEAEKRPTAQEILDDDLFKMFKKVKNMSAKIVPIQISNLKQNEEKLKIKVNQKISAMQNQSPKFASNYGLKILNIIQKRIEVLPKTPSKIPKTPSKIPNSPSKILACFSPIKNSQSQNSVLLKDNLVLPIVGLSSPLRKVQKVFKCGNLENSNRKSPDNNRQIKSPKQRIFFENTKEDSKIYIGCKNQSLNRMGSAKTIKMHFEKMGCKTPLIKLKSMNDLKIPVKIDLPKNKIKNENPLRIFNQNFNNKIIQSLFNKKVTKKDDVYKFQIQPKTPNLKVEKAFQKDLIYASMSNLSNKPNFSSKIEEVGKNNDFLKQGFMKKNQIKSIPEFG